MTNAKIENVAGLEAIKNDYLEQQKKWKKTVLVCGGASCISSDCTAVVEALNEHIAKENLADDINVIITGCMGTCAAGPVLLVEPDGVFYTEMNPVKVKEVVEKHLINDEIIEEYTFYDHRHKKHIPYIKDITFFKDQVRIALRNCGAMEYSSIEAYIARDGYFAIAKAINDMNPKKVVDEVKDSVLRGRGGAGFPTGVKFEAGYNAPGDQKYIVCNADEGDPGAFMDRSIIEGDPHGLIEGMMLGGYAIGANKGFVYVRAEYPIAVERLEQALEQAREKGILGDNILGSDFNFDLEIRIGAGAFVCGEETSLIASIEGKRGEPRQKPPFPFESGLFNKPTIINNVETFANIPPIISNGADWYKQYGTEKSKGTKVFALAGDIVNAGIIEIPMGTVLGDVIYEIGGGLIDDLPFKAVQSGGPSGGCLTKAHLNAKVDYESLDELGAIMGSGGLVVMSENTCMVDTARYFMDFIRDESCGKCLPCRVGTKRMLDILERITEGHGRPGDIEMLEELAETIEKTAMCGLGQTAANPVLSTLQYFREEYENHIIGKHCEAGVCADMQISPCSNACPAHINIPGYLALVSAGRIPDAYNLILEDNPFPAVCGRVCTHPCEEHCRRIQVDESIAICDVKRYIGDYTLDNKYDRPKVKPLGDTDKKVAIIGAGPSGLTCGYYLANLGHEVDVFEAENVAGGVLHWGIPEFRLPRKVLEQEIRNIENAGVNIHLNHKVAQDVDFQKLNAEYDAIYIAVGAQQSRTLSIPGEDLEGMETGLAFLRRVGLHEDLNVPENLVIVGGGSTAMDCARTAIRLGSKKVTVAYRRTLDEMPVTEEELEATIEEGIEIMPLVSPVAIKGENGKITAITCETRELSDYGRDGRRRTVVTPNTEFDIPCDGVIAAINQELDEDFRETSKVKVTKWGEIDLDRFTGQTPDDKVFAGGDASPWGYNIAIYAIADGKLAAKNIDKFLGGKGELNVGEPIDIPIIEGTEVTEPHMRFPTQKMAVDERIDNFDEVELGYKKLDVMAESLRCLHCDRR